MDKNSFLAAVAATDLVFVSEDKGDYGMPVYSPSTYYLDISKSKYFRALLVFRHNIKLASDFYWTHKQNALNTDLFMLTPSVSSPMGPGSDSEAIGIKFGELNTFLVDSSQFGFEPLLMNGLERLYCYLPSMRGENPDARHLNQFFHCEAEIKGTLADLKPQIEEYVRFLSEVVMRMDNITRLISDSYDISKKKVEDLLRTDRFQNVDFNEAVNILQKEGAGSRYVNLAEKGNDITALGEEKLLEVLGSVAPIWLNNYHRDRVPFYQKPLKDNPERVTNADLLFPKIAGSSFGGEIVGSGQRQDNPDEMYESLTRQGVSPEPYEWYIDLRRQPTYTTTSGFGLGVERFIAWVLNKADIKDVILYPRLKNVRTIP